MNSRRVYDKIETQLKIGHATLDRLLIPTFQEWREFRNGLGKQMGEKKIREFLTPKEFQEEVADWSLDTLKRRIKNDGFPAVVDGNSYLIPVEKARLWFKKREIQN